MDQSRIPASHQITVTRPEAAQCVEAELHWQSPAHPSLNPRILAFQTRHRTNEQSATSPPRMMQLASRATSYEWVRLLIYTAIFRRPKTMDTYLEGEFEHRLQIEYPSYISLSILQTQVASHSVYSTRWHDWYRTVSGYRRCVDHIRTFVASFGIHLYRHRYIWHGKSIG